MQAFFAHFILFLEKSDGPSQQVYTVFHQGLRPVLFGDILFGEVFAQPALAAFFALTGQQLVARRISLDHPLTGERFTFESKIRLGNDYCQPCRAKESGSMKNDSS